MASINNSTMANNIFVIFIISLLFSSTCAQLTPNFYRRTCPGLEAYVRFVMGRAIRKDHRMGASILRLFFHDCFVTGCDASILLDDTTTFSGEKRAGPNLLVRGYEVIDTIKTVAESLCRATVSCADILALAARDGVALYGGPSWAVPLGRRDSKTARKDLVSRDIPSPFANLSDLISKFAAKGLTADEMTILSGGHSIGKAHCFLFRERIYDNTSNIDPEFATLRKDTCPFTGEDNNLAPLDQTTFRFDNAYYQDLVGKRGLLHSDQELFNGGSQDELVTTYSSNGAAFFTDFANAMVKLSSITPLTGSNGEIRKNCRVVN